MSKKGYHVFTKNPFARKALHAYILGEHSPQKSESQDVHTQCSFIVDWQMSAPAENINSPTCLEQFETVTLN